MEKPTITITYSFGVSGGDDTLQAFDFMAQALNKFLEKPGVDRLQFCQLLETVARSQQWQNYPPSLGLVSEPPAAPLNTTDITKGA